VRQLAWLAPSATSLAALASQPDGPTWAQARLDPGAVVLVLRQEAARSMGRSESAPFPCFSSTWLASPSLPRDALQLLDQPTGFVGWNDPAFRTIHLLALAAAELAWQQAQHSRCCDADLAWICALLAPLGWLGLCAIDPTGVAQAIHNTPPGQPFCFPQELSPAVCARRLARLWQLPSWLTGVLSCLSLPVFVARSLGVDGVLLALTRAALLQAQGQSLNLGLASSLYAEEDEALLDSVGVSRQWPVSPATPAALEPWQDPRQAPFLRPVLQLAADNRRLQSASALLGLEQEVDQMQALLEQQLHSETQRLQASKLDALAELAAGAGHEINNPLAVICGEAQYLLGHQGQWFTPDAQAPAVKSLQTIVAQTRRIHALLRDLMQFARPIPPCAGWLDLPQLLGEVAASLQELAAGRHVRIEVAAQPERLSIYADAAQLRLALSCLLRNALEAAPSEGWARLCLAEVDAAAVTVLVEDNGPGPEAAQRPHLFDPFYSGRVAGRGRGLGLPVAWRLARQQGGDVRLAPSQAGAPTRFLLTLPRSPAGAAAGPLFGARQAG
jgi:signal transduction histidine kinase